MSCGSGGGQLSNSLRRRAARATFTQRKYNVRNYSWINGWWKVPNFRRECYRVRSADAMKLAHIHFPHLSQNNKLSAGEVINWYNNSCLSIGFEAESTFPGDHSIYLKLCFLHELRHSEPRYQIPKCNFYFTFKIYFFREKNRLWAGLVSNFLRISII
jgi:hypothetical protein